MTMQFRTSPDEWYPEQHTSPTASCELTPGDVVAAQGKPFLVDRVEEIPAERWLTKYVEMWHRQGMPDAAAWRDRPMAVVGFWQGPHADTRAYVLTARACHSWHVLDEHYSVCHRCFEIPPCRHVHADAVVARAGKRMAEDMELRPGLCHACREPITGRQKSVTFPGPNLIRPDLADGTAAFHTRSQCRAELAAYERRLPAAGLTPGGRSAAGPGLLF